MYIMDKNAVSVLGTSEVRWKGQSEIRSADYTVYYSGGERAGWGLGIVVLKNILTCVVKKTVCYDRIIALKSKADPGNILLTQMYMRTLGYEDDRVKDVYDVIEKIL
jgi:hypothetical protein